MQGLLRCNIKTGVHARARRGRIIQRCHNSPRWETGLQSANDITHRKRAEDLGILKKVRELKTGHRTRRVDLRLLAEALSRCRTRWEWGRWKSQNRKIVPLSPYVEKPLSSKVIKSFVPELRSRKCFSCFEIPVFYVIYKWTLYVHFAHPYLAMVHWHHITVCKTLKKQLDKNVNTHIRDSLTFWYKII